MHMTAQKYYNPTEQGIEKRFKDRLESIKSLKLKLANTEDNSE